MKLWIFYIISLVAIACETPEQSEEIRFNHIQVIGSHNSYKIGIEKPLLELLVQEDSGALGLEYRHLSIVDQLELGIRGLEIDVLYDPSGSKFVDPFGLKILDSLGIEALQYDTTNELSKKGFKVFHIPDIDFRSHCLTFKGCLMDIFTWSADHPRHVPIIITINPKNSGIDKPGFTKVTPFSQLILDSLDSEILQVFSDDKLIKPEWVKGSGESLRSAVINNGWPLMEVVRGKVMFVLDAGESLTNEYLKGYESGKPMFVNVDSNHPSAAFFIMNDPKEQREEISELVNMGFMVRTRSDANTVEARNNDRTRFDAAVQSGAQLISTDYYQKELSPNGDFEISFDQKKYVQCNPISSKENCEL